MAAAVADILDSMLVIRMNESHATRTQTVILPLTVSSTVPSRISHISECSMTMGSVWRAASRQGGFVNFQGFAGRQLSFQNAAHFGVVEGLHRQLVEGMEGGGQGIVFRRKRAPLRLRLERSPGSRKHISRRVIVI